MRSKRKITANRANARASTGAKTVDGRRRSARNALRHALSLPVQSNPELSQAVETLAREIAGCDAKAPIQELARHIAEAQIDVCRARHARYQVLSRALNERYASRQRTPTALRSLLPINPPDIPSLNRTEFLKQMSKAPHKLAMNLLQHVDQLLAIDRYERRAFSRRKFAIRAFYKARQRVSDTKD